MYIEEPHIKKLIASEEVVVISEQVGINFEKSISQMPWNLIGTGLDWGRLRGVEFKYTNDSVLQLLEWLRRTSLRADSHLIFFFDPGDPVIAAPISFGVKIIDQVFWKKPGRRHMFGADMSENFKPKFTHIIEYDGADRLTATV